MRLAIVGTRTFHDYALLCDIVAKRYRDATGVTTGCADGTDALARRYAADRGWTVENGGLIIHKADWGLHGRAAGPIRNKLIARDCNALVAFWDGRSRGTYDVIRKARAADRDVRIVRYDRHTD